MCFNDWKPVQLPSREQFAQIESMSYIAAFLITYNGCGLRYDDAVDAVAIAEELVAL